MSQARVVVSKTEDQRFYEVKVPYNINQINMIRSVEGRRWDRDRKLWILPRTKEADAVLQTLIPAQTSQILG
ncbi:MAG: hypothetical protein A2324_04515 [Candidatus Raymondbacteria bacterium RIFOXYB2_FULL_49_35]|nr:MAG: hypothetical protein A2324_04515 [Candidatus Raymondbacteria bacterium RIFOXYB2_FULL_49_35]